MRPSTSLPLVWIAMFLFVACDGNGGKKLESRPAPAPLEPKKDVQAPQDFSGPIDPEWPPSHPVQLQVELEASRIVRQKLREGSSAPKKSQDGDDSMGAPGLFAESGEIGGFSYIEVVVGAVPNPDMPLPLVVLLHGRGGRPRLPQGPFDLDTPVRVFMPQAPDPLGTGFTWLATWTQSGKVQLLTRSISGRADQLAPAIEAFRRLRPTLGLPAVAGFSQGGILSYALATRYPKKFSAAFPMSGWLPPPLVPGPVSGRKYPYIFAQHGRADSIVPTQKGRETVRQLRALGLRVDYREDRAAGHLVTAEMNQQLKVALRRLIRGLKRPRKARN